MDNRFNVNVYCGNMCNNSCRLCKYKGNKNKSIKEISEELDKIKANGISRVELFGGEILIRDDIWELIELVKSKDFFNFAIYTNGRIFYYPEFLKKLLDSGVPSINIKIFGADERSFDKITGVIGSFKQTLIGVQNISKLNLTTFDCNIEFSVPLVKENYRDIKKIIDAFPLKVVRIYNLYFIHDIFENVIELETYLTFLLEIIEQKSIWINVINIDRIKLFKDISPDVLKRIKPILYNEKFCKYEGW